MTEHGGDGAVATTASAPPPRRLRLATIPSRPEPGSRPGVAGTVQVDRVALQKELAVAVDGEVRFDRASLALYATDSSNFRQIPIGVVIPRTPEDVVLTHRVCARHGAPILNRGGGTSLSGETVNCAVVIDHTKYLDAIGEPDVEGRRITVQAGAINEKVNEKAGPHGFVFGPDPSSHAYCAIGGNVGNNSCGVHSVQSQFYGPGPRTSDNVESLEVVTYDGARFRVGVDEEDDLERIIAEGGRKGEIYEKLRDLRERYAEAIRKGFPSVEELPRRVSGYNLDELLPEKGFNPARALVGTEGTCVTVLEATLLLTPAMLERVTVVVAYDDIVQAAGDVPDILGWKPIGLEGIDHRLFSEERRQGLNNGALQTFPRPGDHAWLLVQFGADDRSRVNARGEEFVGWLTGERGLDDDRVVLYRGDGPNRDMEAVWKVREGGLGATAFPPGESAHWPGWEDSAVPPDQVAPYLRDLQGLYEKYGLKGAIYGHFGQGCVHSRISFDLETAGGVADYRRFLGEAADLVVSYGGSLSGEHGDGQQRAEFLVKQYGPELMDAMREFKRIWDPDGKMNPGKVVDPYRSDENLKLGADYNPPHPEVRFSYDQDQGDFAHATIRCVGVGRCRTPDTAGVMCPSYAVTKEEKHTTRGRTRLLFEMLQGDVITDGWESREVYDALDLCLACKGCTNDCPVNVDMPTYKAEFLYHHFKSPRRHRKRQMYAFGFIDQAARAASMAPEVVNFFCRTPPFSSVAKWMAGIDPERTIPSFAPMTLQRWFRSRGAARGSGGGRSARTPSGGSHRRPSDGNRMLEGARNPGGPRVVLWPDTFNNHLHTQVGVAAVEALEDAGWRVVMPEGHVCCGRPLYDYGFLDRAERYLEKSLDALRPEVRAGTPVVGMEPSCLAVFKDELEKMLPHDEDAMRLKKNAYHWAEFFEEFDVEPRRMERRALVWGHCHHKATGGVESERRVLEDRMGMQVEQAEGGCCGLAGSWGFERGRHELSMKCGEIGLLPAVRNADRSTVIVANGFSCKTQLEQSGVGREALHSAEVMKMARDGGGSWVGPPEDGADRRRPAPPLGARVGRVAAAAALGATVLGVGILLGRKAWDVLNPSPAPPSPSS